MAEDHSIGLGGRVAIASTTLKAMLAASARLVSSPFKGQAGAHTYFKDVMFAMMRVQLAHLALDQETYLRVPASDTYHRFCEQHGLTPETLVLPDGTEAYWLGSSKAKKVVLWFHGGGYVLPPIPAHFAYLHSLLSHLPSNTSILVPSYPLAPQNPYPSQLLHATALLRHLLHTTHLIPADISLGGDSAGGNLALALLSHLAHPHPHVPALPLPTRLHAALLLSPWVSFHTHTPAHERNAEKDCFDRRALARWSGAFLGSHSPYAGDFYSEPVTAPAGWWERVASVVGEVLIWGGESEVLIDGIEEFARRFEKGYGAKGGGRVSTVVTRGAAHMEPILELALGYKGDSGTGGAKVVADWARAKL